MSTHSDIERVRKKLNTNGDKLMRGVVLEALKRIKNRTPVDTGRARNNWNVSEGSPDYGTTTATGDTALARGAAVIANLKFGDTAYITNGLPYIPTLEYGGYGPGPKTVGGFSRQAPAGMVGITVAELKPWVDAQVRKLN